MPYQYASEREDNSDLASGRVFYSLPGHPAFPIRLASEIFQRCLALRRAEGADGRCVVYDPCCGAGYQLAVLGYLHRAEIRAAVGSDIDAQAVSVAGQNLGLLTGAGIKQRIAEIEDLLRLYGKESHQEALRSARAMHARTTGLAEQQPLAVKVFQASALDGPAMCAQMNGLPVDIVITDVPYGQHSQWGGRDANRESFPPVETMLTALQGVLAPGGVVAVSVDKLQKFHWEGYRRRQHFQVGKRRILILKWEP